VAPVDRALLEQLVPAMRGLPERARSALRKTIKLRKTIERELAPEELARIKAELDELELEVRDCVQVIELLDGLLKDNGFDVT
jgi:hypothetical protein